MMGIVDPNFRRGLGLMLTGLWITLFGFALALGSAFLGPLGILLGLIAVIVGGAVLARGYETMTNVPAVPPAASREG